MTDKVTTGIDIIEIGRIKEAVSSWNSAFLNRVYTPSELEACHNSPASLAGRFAAKEAVLKAINPAQLVCNWHEIEVLSASSGRPVVKLHGSIRLECSNKNMLNVDVSISHCRDYAVAVAVAQC